MGTITSLVTGGPGFLGSHLYEYLLARGQRVICVENLETGSLENIRHLQNGNDLRLEVLDITEHSEVDEPVGAEIYGGNVHAIGPRGGYDEVKRCAEALTIVHPRRGVDTCLVKSSTRTGHARAQQRTRIPTFLRQALADDLTWGLMALAESEVHEPVGIATPRSSRRSRWQSS